MRALRLFVGAVKAKLGFSELVLLSGLACVWYAGRLAELPLVQYGVPGAVLVIVGLAPVRRIW